MINGETMVGGGSLPGGSLPTKLVAISDKQVSEIARKLRLQTVPVIGRIEKDRLLFDPRTVLPEDDVIVIKTLTSLLKK
jgi:L-seryl-tRNA(Ser) seleniumtransferase